MLSPAWSNAAQDVYTEYPEPKRDEWQTKVLPVLKEAPLSQLVRMTEISRSELQEIRAGRRRPHPNNQTLLTRIAKQLSAYDPERKR